MAREQWDAVIVGSGVGGLVTGALLARTKGWKVLVLEKHYRFGGFTHTFNRRREFAFDVGTHYVGELGPGGDLRTLLDYLTGGALEWDPLPHEFEELHLPERRWKIPGKREEHCARLSAEFPRESAALLRYFQEERKIAEAYSAWQLSEQSAAPLARLMRGYLRFARAPMLSTTTAALESRFRDPQLRALLAGRWMGYGVPPHESSFGMHCLHAHHYGEGAWYPRGGGEAIADTLTKTITSHGGAVLARTAVEEILVENGRATGVRAAGVDGEGPRRYGARIVVSNVGARTTYLQLLRAPPAFAESLRRSPVGRSMLSLFLGLRESPRARGFDAINYWLIPPGPPRVADRRDVLAGELTAFLSFPSLKRGTRAHTAQLILMAENSIFPERRDGGGDYEELKERVTEALLRFLENRFPGFRSLIDFHELSTPATVERFVSSPQGAVYGIPTTPARFFYPWARSRSPVPGLFLTGTDVFSPGISGAIHGAVKAFRIIAEEQGP